MTTSLNTLAYDSQTQRLDCAGSWDLATLVNLQAILNAIQWPTQGVCTFDGSKVEKMDSAGAWLICDWMRKLEHQGIKVNLEKFPEQKSNLLAIVKAKLHDEPEAPLPPPPESKIKTMGRNAVTQYIEFKHYLAFVGRLTYEAIRIAYNPLHWRWSALTSTIFRTGYQALPIIALLSFMIGVVITFQMGLQLKNYGANIFIVDLLGLAILREFGPLLTAIMVAGRTGSAFTAQLGMMKLNQEIDALDTMGVTPAELLLLPRIIGLLIALPLITMWADIFGVIGGMIMSNNMLNITWYDFMQRFPKVIPLRALLIGIGKAPVFALVISSVGCYQGMRVEGNADSVGTNTTRSVVLSIFFIIVVDAVFSVILSKLKL